MFECTSFEAQAKTGTTAGTIQAVAGMTCGADTGSVYNVGQTPAFPFVNDPGPSRPPRIVADSPQFPWFAIRVKPKHEKTASAALAAKGYESFLPLFLSRRKCGDRFKNFHLPLFAGYSFCRFDPTDRLPILKTDSVLSILGNGRELVSVPDREIAALQVAVASRLAVQPHPFLNVGDRVTLAEGPLRGSHGILVQLKGQDHLVVSVTILQRSISVQIDRAWVRPPEQ
jgi:transcription antitermination factor NusG